MAKNEKIVNKFHASTLLRGLDSLRTESQLCDIVLKVSDLSIGAHRNVLAACSPFFYAMFCGSFVESTKENVILHDLDPIATKDIIHYIYTGEIEISGDNVQSLHSIATFMQIQFIQEECCKYLKDALDPSNCIGIKRFAGKTSCYELEDEAEQFAANSFHKLIACDEFLQLNLNELQKILSHPNRYQHKDEVIFTGIMRWVNHDPANRTDDLNKLLAFVHPFLVEKELVREQALLMNTPSCSEWLSKTLDAKQIDWNIFFFDKFGKVGDLNRYGLNAKTTIALKECPIKAFAISMVGYKTSLYVQGGAVDRQSTRNHYCYNIYRDHWIPLNKLRLSRSHHRSCILNDSIYIIGGNNMMGPLSDVEVYDLYTGRTYDIELMYEERSSMGAAVSDNVLYVMGGERENQCLFTAERYDPRTGYWNTLASMNQVNSYCSSAVISGNIYCSEGVGNCMERYDVRMNCWELIQFKTNREFYELFSIDDELYSIAGFGIYKYSFADNEWTSVLEFDEPRSWDTALPLKMQIM